MRFLVAFNIFLMVFGLAECNWGRIKGSQQRNSCQLGLGAGLKATILKTKCTPRPTLVELDPVTGYQFKPPIVEVNRCAGNCESNNCVPLKSRIVTRIVRRVSTNVSASLVECIPVKLEAHEECGCACKPTDCDNLRFYDQHTCSCLCKDDRKQKRDCESQPGMKWSDIECNCKCTINDMECTSGHVWKWEACKCVHEYSYLNRRVSNDW